MPRFLHLADVHLGFDRYDHPKRTLDFFLAFKDAIQRYAIDDPVDFVLIAGDLFEHHSILPATLNQAQSSLDLLWDAGIPVLAIEGNHDHRPYQTKTSWLRYLADWGRLILLEPEEEGEGWQYLPWSEEDRRGGYIDLDCGVRVIGSRWYGSSSPQMIERLATSIAQLPPSPGSTVMMFHHGLEGQVARYTGALRYEDLLPLKDVGVDYLALGHIHKHYTEQGWIFNPGSVEANSVAENQEQTVRGVYRVELQGQGIQADLKRDYYQRPILRLTYKAEKTQTQADLEQALLTYVQAQAQTQKTQDAIVELRIQGQVGFDRLDLNLRALRDQLQQMSEALIFLLKYEAIGTEYETYLGSGTEDSPHRSEIEQQVFIDLLAAHSQYENQAPLLAKGLTELKDRVLAGQPDGDLYGFVKSFFDLYTNPL